MLEKIAVAFTRWVLSKFAKGYHIHRNPYTKIEVVVDFPEVKNG